MIDGDDADVRGITDRGATALELVGPPGFEPGTNGL